MKSAIIIAGWAVATIGSEIFVGHSAAWIAFFAYFGGLLYLIGRRS